MSDAMYLWWLLCPYIYVLVVAYAFKKLPVPFFFIQPLTVP